MTTITNFLIMDGDGDEIEADAYGDHLAFDCFICGHPVLACASEGKRGSDEEHPVACKGCEEVYFLDVRSHAEKLYVHNLNADE